MSPDTKKLSLYGYPHCPYCRRVLQAIDQLGLDIELRNTMENPDDYRDLVEATGRATVPVLRIESPDVKTRWLPESADIIDYLDAIA